MKNAKREDALNRAVIDFYAAKFLDTTQSEFALKNILVENISENNNNDSPNFSFRSILLLGLSLLFGVGLSVLYHHVIESPVRDSVIDEISMNHLKNLDVEIEFNTFDGINKRMMDLDFYLLTPDKLDKYQKVLGGRYCSINGNLAAQIKLKDSITGYRSSLYVTLMRPALEGIPGQCTGKNKATDNVTISCWQEKNLFYAWVKSKLSR